ncbi:DUF4382 domain-containing protein [Croceitalea marina]|uniref:DUF4382 domain-containing protein n=1 Tax=Croceitalea marina TaxID=1775166 RepID=A0ABW5MX07_9FLAO
MKKNLIFSFFLASALLFIGCSDDSNTNSETGRLSVRLTDAPFPYALVAEANVTIFKIEARLQSDDDEENDDSSFVVLMEDEIDTNLLELTNGVTEQLANVEVPVGTYDLFRVYVRGVNVVLTDGRTFDLKVPSGEQSGIKVFIKPGLTVAGGLSSDLLLDFDVSRSFVAKGNTKRVDGINGFNFKPVIKASNIATSGTLAGTITTITEDVETALEGAQISVIVADTLNTSAFSDVDGNYMIMGLNQGTYKAIAELEGYIASDTVEVQIVASNKTIQNFILEEEAN